MEPMIATVFDLAIFVCSNVLLSLIGTGFLIYMIGVVGIPDGLLLIMLRTRVCKERAWYVR